MVRTTELTAFHFALIGMACAAFALLCVQGLEKLKYGSDQRAELSSPLPDSAAEDQFTAAAYDDRDLMGTLLLSDPFSPATLSADEAAEIGVLVIGPKSADDGVDI